MAILMFPISMSIIAYGIIKQNLFDIDIIIKKSILYAIITTVLAIIFFLIEELLEGVVTIDAFGSAKVSGLISAGVVVLSSMPIKALAIKLIDKLFPDIKTNDDANINRERNMIVYGDILRIAWEDGKISKKEDKMLQKVRELYGISMPEHKKIEKKIKTETADIR